LCRQGTFRAGPFGPDPRKAYPSNIKRLFDKWRLVRRLNKEIKHAKELFSTPPITVQPGFFVVQNRTVAVRGLFVERIILDRYGSPKVPTKDLNRKAIEINSLLDACVADEYMNRVFREGDRSTFLVTITSKGEDFCEPTGLVQAMLSQFDRIWLIVSSVLGPVAAYLAGEYKSRIAEAVSKLLIGQ
jgi:hypothetical protein